MSIKILDEIESRQLFPGTKVRFVHTEANTFAYWDFEPGIDLPSHSHPHEQVTNIIEGIFELTVEGKTETLTPGKIAVIAPNLIHSGHSVTQCKILDVFSPVREDYK